MLSARKTQCFARRFPALYVPPHPIRFSNPIIPKQNRSHHSNVICDGSPSRIRIVRRISLGITTRPRSSMRRTIPVAFILDSSRICRAGARQVYCIALENMDSIRRTWEGMQIFGWICFPAGRRRNLQKKTAAGIRRLPVFPAVPAKWYKYRYNGMAFSCRIL